MKVKDLQLSSSSLTYDDTSHQNDILFRTDSAELKKESFLKGSVSVLVVSAGGLRHQWKPRWASQDRTGSKLRFYKNETEEDMVGEIDIMGATYVYDAADLNGQFKICTTEEEQTIDVGTAENRLYWLQQLQKARREFTQNFSTNQKNPGRAAQLGLLKEGCEGEGDSTKEGSPFKDILATMERPAEVGPIRSADYVTKKSFFQNFTRKPSFKQLVRSSSDGTPPTAMGVEQRSPPPNKPFSSPTHGQGSRRRTEVRGDLCGHRGSIQ